MFSRINCNTKNSDKLLFSGLNPPHSILQVPEKTKLQCITIS